ncbi:MAG: efflux RND transporter permease subunit [Gemmataceae bacterium]
MLNYILAFSLKNRVLVLLVALLVVVYGGYQLTQMPVDVFPDLNRPTVTLLTEAPGLAPEEVEVLVTRPVEYLLNGATGVQRVRSASGIGLSVVWVEFEWGTDIYQDRQVVAEKLQLARERLPQGANPVMAPISSIMGEIMLLGVRSTANPKTPAERERKAMELRTLAEFTLRNRLLAVEGVSQVTVMGGVLKQYQVVTSPERLAAQNVTLQQLTEAAEKANVIAGGGILVRSPKESLIRISGQSLTLADIEETPVVWREPRPVLVKDVAEVRFGGPVPRGAGGVKVRDGDAVAGGPAVIMTVQKQPNANTLVLDPRIDAVLEQLQRDLPADVRIEKRIFKQADFIQSAVDNVVEAIRDGTVWVFVILFLFLWNLRTSVITLTAIPLSMLVTVLVFRWLGVSINTMTLGGIAVAVGELVDDAIVDVENIYRRLKENGQRERPESALKVVFLASSEVRNSIVYATLIVCLVVLPLFAMAGLEGRMFAPLGLAYLVSLLASLLVSLTVTPVLASYLLPRAKFMAERRDPFLLRWLKALDERILRIALRHPWPILVCTAFLAFGSKLVVFWMGSEFLPPFNEGTLTINVQTDPGTSLAESERVAGRVESLLLQVPEVLSVSRRTGRAEMDEHAEGVNSSELDVRLQDHERVKPGWGYAFVRAVPGLHRLGVDVVGRPHDAVLADVRDKVTSLPNVKVNVGQPISHRLDHIMSGVRAQVAVKVVGPDLRELRNVAYDAQARMSQIPGVVDLQVEPQVEISQLRLKVKRQEAARHGLTPGDVARLLETAYKGRTVSTVLDGDRYFDLVVWYDERSRADPATIARTVLDTPSGRKVALGQVADVLDTTGPNTINREHVERRIVVACNVQGRDLGGVVADIRAAMAPVEESLRKLPGTYGIEYGGQFEAQQQASTRLSILATLAVVGVFLLLTKCLDSWQAALQVLLVNIPLAALGSVIALLVINRPDPAALQAAPWWQWPRVWAAATTLSVAHWVGFITLIGIVSRNGIMMISHYIHLMKHEGEQFDEKMIIRGSLERLAPVLMTAFVAVMGLIPLVLGAGQTGKEILHPGGRRHRRLARLDADGPDRHAGRVLQVRPQRLPAERPGRARGRGGGAPRRLALPVRPTSQRSCPGCGGVGRPRLPFRARPERGGVPPAAFGVSRSPADVNAFPPASDVDFRDPALADLVRGLGLYHAKTPSEYEWRLQTRLSHGVYQQLVKLRAELKLHSTDIVPSQFAADDQRYYQFLDAHPLACRATAEGRLGYYDRLLPLLAWTLAGVPKARILDLGCFSGLSTLYLGRTFPDSTVVGIERYRGFYEVAEEGRKAVGAANVSFVHGDYTDFRPERPFDAVVSLQTLPGYMLPWLPSESPDDYRRGRHLAAEIENASSPAQAVLRSLAAVRSLASPTGLVVFNERLHGLPRALLFHALLARTGLEVLHAHMVDWHMAGQKADVQTSPLIVARPCTPPANVDEAAVIHLYTLPAGYTDLSDLPAAHSVTWQGFDAHANYRSLPGDRDELVVAAELKSGQRFHQHMGVLGGRLAYVYLCDTMDRRNLTVTHTRNMRPLFKTARDLLAAARARGEVARVDPEDGSLDYALTKRFRRYEP